jgi:hypothetical protein
MGKLKESLQDEIVFNLHFTDIQCVDNSLTNEEARQIMHLIKRNYVADLFYNEMIDSWIQFYKSHS